MISDKELIKNPYMSHNVRAKLIIENVGKLIASAFFWPKYDKFEEPKQ